MLAFSKSFARYPLRLVIVSLAVAFLIIIAWRYLAGEGFHYEWQWNRLWRHLGSIGPNGFEPGPLLKGIGMTLAITAAGLPLSIIFGLGGACLRLAPWPLCNQLAIAYINLWRNTPLLLQLFFAYFLISPLLHISPLWTAVFSLAIFEGAYLAEIFRSGLLSVSPTQWEASLSLGFSLSQTLFRVILPQAMRNTLPSLANQGIALLKDTSLVSAIAVADLTMQSQAIVAETFLAFEVWLLAGAIYLLMALCIALPSLWLEKHYRWK